MLDLEQVSASHDGQRILEDVQFHVSNHEIVALIGPSGTGKSTLLQTIMGLHPLDGGSIYLEGKPVSPKLHSIGWMPQDYGLLPWDTVRDNILLSLVIRKEPITTEKQVYLDQLIQVLGLEPLLTRYPKQLSGGQQQRVAIARAMAMSPDIMLLDEPFSALDAITRENMQHLFLTQWEQEKVPTILITHDVEEAVFLGHRLILLAGKPGKVVDIMINPTTDVPLSMKRLDPRFYETTRHVREALNQWY